ncbi:MAG: TonB-dependent receptor plug domain-containing protein [Bacteroidota bacterium]|nr:TonB-dependent receptor plug domain-containing protein [Bacteroidota bacterium]
MNIRLIRILTVLSVVGSLSIDGVAQTSMTVDTTVIQPASVTGSFANLPPQQAPRALVVIGQEEVAQTAAASIADVLESIPGVDVRARGPFGIQTDLSLRGGTFNQTALWVDGIRWSAPHTDHHLLNLPLDPEDITKVEVLRGGASSALGTGAMTGAVALTAGPATQDGSKVVAETGTNNWARIKVTTDFGTSLSSTNVRRHRISASRASTDGTLGAGTNTDADMTRMRYSGWLAGKWGSLRTSVGYADKAFGALNFYSANFPIQYEETRTIQGQALYSKTMQNVTLEAGLHHRTHVDEFQLYREGEGFYQYTDDDYLVLGDDTAGVYRVDGVTQIDSLTGRTITWYRAPNNHISHTTGGRALLRLSSKLGQTFASVDSRREFIKSNLLGVDSLGDDEGVYVRGDVRLNTDVSIGHRAELGSIALSATAAWNINSMFGSRFVPGVELSVDMADDGSSILFVSANRSVRHPSYTNLYYTIGGAVGSRDLQPEMAEQIEAGVRLSLAENWPVQIQFEQALFERRGSDMIDWARPNGSDTTFAINLRAVTFIGLESVATFIPNQEADGERKLRYGRLGYAIMEASESSVGYESNYLLDFLQTKLDASVGFTAPGGILIDGRWSYQDRIGGYYDVAKGEEVEFEPFTLVSVTASRLFWQRKVRAYARVDNALDRTVVDLGNVQQPGRWWRLGVAYTFR